MAKQTFTTGQVLTAAQMTSLQQTAMGGGSPSTKTASYILTAADAGTVIQMNSASATTITVNTSLFAAGDSVQIQNIGAGTTTITAGTATVNTAGSLAVTQYDGGFLFFNSASSAIWFDYTQPATAAGNMVQIATGTLSGASVTISSLSTYDNLILAVYNTTNSTADGITKIRINNNSGSNYQTFGHYWDGSSPQNYASSNDAIFASVANNDRTVSANSAVFKLTNAKQTGFTDFNVFARNYSGSNRSATFEGVYTQSEAVSSLVILNSGGNWSAGTYTLWGS